MLPSPSLSTAWVVPALMRIWRDRSALATAWLFHRDTRSWYSQPPSPTRTTAKTMAAAVTSPRSRTSLAPRA